MRPSPTMIAWVAAVFATSGCSVLHKYSYKPEELRAELRQRIPDIAEDELVVPFEVSPEQVRRARGSLLRNWSTIERALSLMESLFDRRSFGLRYADAATRTASQTLARGRGNCLSLASVYIGLARGLGLRAFYVDVSDRFSEVHTGDDMVVRTGHITAIAKTPTDSVALDLTHLRNRMRVFRIIDDFEALAHFHNNRGYELIHAAAREGLPVDWAQVARRFHTAVRIDPRFVRGWNNLGVAYVRLGRRNEAAASYRKAISLDPGFASPHTNLGILRLAGGDPAEALTHFDRAADIDAGDPRVHYHRGVALFRLGRLREAVAALEEAISEQADFARARKLLGSIYLKQGRDVEAARICPAFPDCEPR